METKNTTEGLKMTNPNALNPNMEPVKIASGRFVGFGHYVENFGQTAVVVGSRDVDGNGDLMLVVRPVNSAGKMARAGWLAAPKFCK